MENKDKIIDSLRKQLAEALKKVSALEQEVALLEYMKEGGVNRVKANPLNA